MPLKSGGIIIFKFRKVVQKHTYGEMDNLDNVCIQNFPRNLTVKKIVNQSTFAEVMIKSQVY